MTPRSFASAAVAAAVLSACGASPDGAFHTMAGAQVYDLGGGVFEVATPRGRQGGSYWCGASDYARRELGAGWQSRIYVHRGLGPGQVADSASTVQFTLTPGGGGDGEPQDRNAYRPGDSRTVQSAYCEGGTGRPD